jgi:hypothetical protein
MARCEFGFFEGYDLFVHGDSYKITALEIANEEKVDDQSNLCFISEQHDTLMEEKTLIGNEYETFGKCKRCKADVHVKFKRVN